MQTYGAGVRITLSGPDEAAVEMAADELKQRLGARFAVMRRRRGRNCLRLMAVMLTGSAAHVDAGASDLIDRLYAGQPAGPGRAANPPAELRQLA
ncbi:hypothetical protein [Teichococcus oryzae]|uniref:Uncharacterized protein n=1 Tax=Teichococcus oryzae TaxID=1608942 RepID=A0A5B2TF88_9PROT|nr:hypothetical protein [Pseudoroseomonas oryzae]KAA2212558.1 hypothetical protein F0Q34_14645 [Pseudoroseomonas oryzae]